MSVAASVNRGAWDRCEILRYSTLLSRPMSSACVNQERFWFCAKLAPLDFAHGFTERVTFCFVASKKERRIVSLQKKFRKRNEMVPLVFRTEGSVQLHLISTKSKNSSIFSLRSKTRDLEIVKHNVEWKRQLGLVLFAGQRSPCVNVGLI